MKKLALITHSFFIFLLISFSNQLYGQTYTSDYYIEFKEISLVKFLVKGDNLTIQGTLKDAKGIGIPNYTFLVEDGLLRISKPYGAITNINGSFSYLTSANFAGVSEVAFILPNGKKQFIYVNVSEEANQFVSPLVGLRKFSIINDEQQDRKVTIELGESQREITLKPGESTDAIYTEYKTNPFPLKYNESTGVSINDPTAITGLGLSITQNSEGIIKTSLSAGQGLLRGKIYVNSEWDIGVCYAPGFSNGVFSGEVALCAGSDGVSVNLGVTHQFVATSFSIKIWDPNSNDNLPDLKPINPSVIPSSVQAGSTITVNCAEDNSGSLAAPANKIFIYLSENSVLNENEDTKIGEISVTSTIAANSSSIVYSQPIQIPANTPAKTYNLFFWVDGGKTVTEIWEDNNFASVPLTVTAAPNPNTPVINPSVPSLAFGDVRVSESLTKNFTISGSDLTGSVSVSVSGAGYTISKSESSGFSTSSLSFTPSSGTLSSQTVYVRFSPTSTGSKTGSISITSSGASSKTVSLSGAGTAVATPSITSSESSLSFGNVTVNTNSTKSFTVSGSNLTDIVAVAVSGTEYQISKSQSSGFTSALSFSPSGGSVSGTVYVRFNPTTIGSKPGTIAIVSSGAIDKFVSLSGSGISGGSAPSNDNSCSPQPLTIRTSCSYESFTTINATPPSPDIPFTGASLPYQSERYDDDVWFSITPNFSAPISIKVVPTSNLSNFDVSVGLYQGSCSNPTQIQIGQGVAGNAGDIETINFTSQSYTTYLIRVFSYGIGSSYSGDFDICVTSDDGEEEEEGEDDFYIDNAVVESKSIPANGTTSVSCEQCYLGSKTESELGTVIAGFYLSKNNTFGSSDILLETNSSTLGRNDECNTENENLKIPGEIIPGEYYILFVADHDDEFDESDEENNIVAVKITVTESSDDFYTSNESIIPLKALANGTIKINFDFCYSGSALDAEIGNCRLGFYLSTDNNFSKASDTYLGALITGLGSDDPCSSSNSSTQIIPDGTSPGIYYIFLVVDDDDRFVEIDESNNLKYLQISVLNNSAGEDFYIHNCFVNSNSVAVGATLDVSCNQCYMGNILDDDMSSSDVGYYLSKNTTWELNEDTLLAKDPSSLGSDYPCDYEEATITIPTGIISGEYYILFVADYQKEFTESFEDNNVSYLKIIITGDECNLSVAETSSDFTSMSGSKTIAITSNSEWTITKSESWITLSTEFGSGNETLTITVEENTGASRTGTITISGCNIFKIITINQEGKPELPPPTNFLSSIKSYDFYGLHYSIDFNWTSPVSEISPISYKIYSGDTENGTYRQIATTSGLQYTFKIQADTIDYESSWFYVTAVYETGESATDSKINIMPDAPVLTLDGSTITTSLNGESFCWSCWYVESHWYKFYAPPLDDSETKTYGIKVTGLDLSMALYKSDKTTLIESNDNQLPYGDSEITISHSEGEWYYVLVSASRPGIYTIEAKTQNNVPYRNLVLDWPYNAKYNNAPKAFEYRFTTGIEGIYTIQTNGGLNTTLNLYDANGLIEQDDDDGDGTNALIQRTLEANSTYILRFTASSNGNFSIIVNAPITELFVNDPCFSSSIIYATEVDWYKFRTGMGGMYAIEQSVNSLLYVSLYENDKTTLLATGGYPGEAGQQSIEQELNANAEYYIKINSAYDWRPPEIVNNPYCISVKPAKPAPFLIVSPTNITLGGESGTNGIFEITSDTNWSILVSADAYWLKLSTFSGSNNGTITVTTNSTNSGTSQRTGTVTIRSEGLTDKTVLVTQKENISNCHKHFHTVWEGQSGVDHMNINVIEAKLNGFSLEPGDEIGVFDGELCVGYGKVIQTIDHQNILNIKVSRNEGTGNGYNVGNEVLYKFWDCSANTEIIVNNMQCFNNQFNPVACNPFQTLSTTYVQLSAINDICQTLQLSAGWNIFSVSAIPVSANIVNVFQPMINSNSLVKIQDEEGNSLEDWGIFGGWQNYIGNISPSEGYKIKLGKNDNLEVCGVPVKYPYAISLKSGWNIIGYPQTNSVDGIELVQQLIDRRTLVKIQDEVGNSIEDWGIFGSWQNNIGNFMPGEGYNIKVSADDTLWIYESYPKSSAVLPVIVSTSHFAPVFNGNGMDHMNINLVGLPVNILQAGDELAIFDGATCVGAVTLMPHHLRSQTVSIVTSATDNQGMPGFFDGNPFVLKLWNAKNHQEFKLEPEIVKGTSTFIRNETTIASLEKYATTGLDGLFASEQPEIHCYPNPFSDEITVEISLFDETEVHVEVLNQLGQQVKTLAAGEQLNRGVHRLIWDGTNAGKSRVAPGIYLIRMKIDDTVYYRKLIYSK